MSDKPFGVLIVCVCTPQHLHCQNVLTAALRQFNPYTKEWHEGTPLEYDGLEIALVRFSNGVLGKVSVNFECIQPYTFPLEIFGDRGTIKDNRLLRPGR